MPHTPHVEKHFTASEYVRDIVIGTSDGLTVPFSLAAGLSEAVDPFVSITTRPDDVDTPQFPDRGALGQRNHRALG